MIIETNDMLYNLKEYCEHYHLPYDTINAYRANHKELSTMEAIEAWKGMKRKQREVKEFCRLYDISTQTYRRKLKIMTKEELAKEIEEIKILYDEQYISVRKYCKLNNIDYGKVASKAQREGRSIKEVVLEENTCNRS